MPKPIATFVLALYLGALLCEGICACQAEHGSHDSGASEGSVAESQMHHDGHGAEHALDMAVDADLGVDGSPGHDRGESALTCGMAACGTVTAPLASAVYSAAPFLDKVAVAAGAEGVVLFVPALESPPPRVA